jgi:mono/diheme cytochrome c family protein
VRVGAGLLLLDFLLPWSRRDRRSRIMKAIFCGVIAALLIPVAYAALPGDGAEGQRLHQASCTGCHDSRVYTRPNRVVRSLNALKQQVEGCGHAAKKEFSAAEIQNLVKCLNDGFYHFQ